MKLASLFVALAFVVGCGGKTKPEATPRNSADPAAAGSGSDSAMCDDPNCQGGMGTCLALCKGTQDECAKQCDKPVCPKIACPAKP